MTPAPSPRHQWSSKKLQRQLEDGSDHTDEHPDWPGLVIWLGGLWM